MKRVIFYRKGRGGRREKLTREKNHKISLLFFTTSAYSACSAVSGTANEKEYGKN